MNRETVIPTGTRIGGSESDSVTVEPFVWFVLWVPLRL